MSNALTDAIKEAYASAPSNDAVFETIQLSHPSIAEDIFLVRNRTDLELTLETSETVTFKACGFGMSLPKKGDSGLQELNLSIDNVDRRISDFLNTAKNFTTKVSVTYRPYLQSDPSQPQMDPPLVLCLSDVKVDLFQCTGKASFADLLNKKYPSQNYTRKKFPSLGG